MVTFGICEVNLGLLNICDNHLNIFLIEYNKDSVVLQANIFSTIYIIPNLFLMVVFYVKNNRITKRDSFCTFQLKFINSLINRLIYKFLLFLK